MNRMNDQSRKETRLAAIEYFILKPAGFSIGVKSVMSVGLSLGEELGPKPHGGLHPPAH